MQNLRGTLQAYSPTNDTLAGLRSVLLAFFDGNETDVAILIGRLREEFSLEGLFGKEATTDLKGV